jgi:hypothetical protein
LDFLSLDKYHIYQGSLDFRVVSVNRNCFLKLEIKWQAGASNPSSPVNFFNLKKYSFLVFWFFFCFNLASRSYLIYLEAFPFQLSQLLKHSGFRFASRLDSGSALVKFSKG